MNDLKSFVALQTRLYEFLERQDEATLRGILDGTVELAVVPADDAAPVGSSYEVSRGISQSLAADPVGAPSTIPLQVVQDLLRLPSGQQRSFYLNGADLPLQGLRQVAKLLGLRGYTKPRKAELLEILVHHDFARNDAAADEPPTPAPALDPPDGKAGAANTGADDAADNTGVGHTDTGSTASQPTPNESGPVLAAAPTGAASPNADAARIAAQLRATETEGEGIAYLREQHLDRASLLSVAAELQLTRVDRLSRPELEKRVLKQAIGARRKFAGLRKW
ncbi:hypothetical protein [Nocardia australiensis]|uniref:hypothetical protein n=1 Tax=Nocardia australiensis TaxID=2887191 RepID=UPI001D140573|nr:hypothetical protein [Nocardia australiensis]